MARLFFFVILQLQILNVTAFIMASFRFIFIIQYLHASGKHMVFIMAREQIAVLMQ